MSDLSWNEIRARAAVFAREWEGETNERAEASSFWDAFFRVFGVDRRRIGAAFEYAVKKTGGAQGFVDLFWKGVLIAEHKSRGRDLDRAAEQARDYFPGLRDDELPRYVVVSDFARVRLYDLGPPGGAASGGSAATEAPAEPVTFDLADFPAHVERFAFILGRERRVYAEQDPVNVEAAQRMGALHDRLREAGYTGHVLDVYLVRLLFCLFADDTGLFERGAFADLIDRRSRADGADLARLLAELFEVLDTPPARRLTTLDADLAAFPYVNGGLFAERLPTAAFDAAMRGHLLGAGALDWGAISPAIFGSLFQSAMDPDARRALGAHYTSEGNIQKLLGPLLFDGLRSEVERARSIARPTDRRRALETVLNRLASVTLLDPACGCGNFLVVAYRELRTLELDALRALYADEIAKGLQVLDIAARVRVNVGQCFGLEIEEFPAQIAAVALWLTDHQMNLRASEAFGTYFARLPLTQSAHVRHANALRVDWAAAFGDDQPAAFTAILGNPPFVGKKEQTPEQKADLLRVCSEIPRAGVLDFVAAWYVLAARYMTVHPETRTAFVSTNSVAQGEQVGTLWGPLLVQGVRLDFAHRTFKWTNEAPGRAAVYVVIVGFGMGEGPQPKRLFEYATPTSDPHEMPTVRLNPYLVDGPDVVVSSQRSPLSAVPPMMEGSALVDSGHLVLSDDEAAALRLAYPMTDGWMLPLYSGDDYMNGARRWALWLADVPPGALRQCPPVMERIERVQAFRRSSGRPQTLAAAATPTLFAEIRQPSTPYLFVPKTSSERRAYVPIGFMEATDLINNTSLFVADATLYHFGVLSSAMNMAWLRTVGGRMKSDYRYSGSLVYNTFVWPDVSATQRAGVEALGQAVLDARAPHLAAGSTLADLYDPLAMPPALAKAHAALDRAVDRAYRASGFASEAARVAHLFEAYAALTAGLFAAAPKGTGRRCPPPAAPPPAAAA